MTSAKVELCYDNKVNCYLVNSNYTVTSATSRLVWYLDPTHPYVSKNDVQAKVTDLATGVTSYGPIIRILAPVSTNVNYWNPIEVLAKSLSSFANVLESVRDRVQG